MYRYFYIVHSQCDLMLRTRRPTQYNILTINAHIRDAMFCLSTLCEPFRTCCKTIETHLGSPITGVTRDIRSTLPTCTMTTGINNRKDTQTLPSVVFRLIRWLKLASDFQLEGLRGSIGLSTLYLLLCIPIYTVIEITSTERKAWFDLHVNSNIVWGTSPFTYGIVKSLIYINAFCVQALSLLSTSTQIGT